MAMKSPDIFPLQMYARMPCPPHSLAGLSASIMADQSTGRGNSLLIHQHLDRFQVIWTPLLYGSQDAATTSEIIRV